MTNGDRPADLNQGNSGEAEPVKLASTQVCHGVDSRKQKHILKVMRKNTEATACGFGNVQLVGDASTPAPETNRGSKTVGPKPLALDPQPYLFAAVNPEDVEEGRAKQVRNERGQLQYQPGVLQFGSKEDVEKFQTWLNAKIPSDGTEATDDRRSALIVMLALKNATVLSNKADEQAAYAYMSLNAMRHVMEETGSGFSNDPGIANAEHFLETAHRVGGHPFDGTASDLSGQILRGKWSAPVWEGLSAGYNELKRIGFVTGSKAENQHKWESSGIAYGKSIYDAVQA